MQASAIDRAPDAVRPVLLAHRDGAPTPFELWHADAASRLTPGEVLGVDAIVATFFRLNGGPGGVRWLEREGLSDVYVQQLERTIGRTRTVAPPHSPEAAGAPDSFVSAPEAIDAPQPAAISRPGGAPSPPRRGSSARRRVYTAGLLAGAAVGVALIVIGPEWDRPGLNPAPRKASPDASAPPQPRPRLAPRHDAAGQPPRPTAVARSRPPAPPLTGPSAQKPRPTTPPPTNSTVAPSLAKARKAPPSVAATAGKHIRVSMARRRVEVLEGGEVVRVLEHVSFGRTGHRTPILTNASLSPTRRERMHRSKLYGGTPMPYSLFLEQSPNIAFHAGDTGARSHGCIHLRRADAKWLFKWVGADPVRVDIRPA